MITKKVIDVLAGGKADIFSLNEFKPYLDEKAVGFITPDEITSEIDFAVTIGGDGTIIKAANLLLEHQIPIIGVNLGTLGFLAGIEKTEIDKLSYILQGDYVIDERMTLKAIITHDNGISEELTAINDIAIGKNAFSGIIDLDVFCSDIETAHYRGDGIIFSTSSGSTAYAMSAGGPIIHPDVKSISLTPICAHSLLSRTIILPEYEKITVKTNADSVRRRVFVVSDGMNLVDINENDKIEISRYHKNIKFIRLKEKNYYATINEKLMER